MADSLEKKPSTTISDSTSNSMESSDEDQKSNPIVADLDDFQLLDVKAWLTNQTEEHKIWEESERIDLPPSDAEIEISRLIEKFHEKTSIDSQRESTVEKIQIGQLFLKSVFEKDDPAIFNFSKQLKTLMLHHRQHSAEIAKSHKELSSLQAELDGLKSANQKQMMQNRDQMVLLDDTNKNLQSVKKQYDCKKEESAILEELQRKKNENNAIRHIMQTLIIASGVNWTADSELLDTMIKLGIELQY